MSFMQPQIVDYSDVADAIADERRNEPGYIADDGDDDTDVATSYKYACRLSARGYLDATDWTPCETIPEAVKELLGMYGDGFDVDDLQLLGTYLDGFDEFLNGYLIGLAFTAQRYETENDEPKPLFSNAGGDIRDVVDGDDVFDKLDDETKQTVLSDCLSFFCDAKPYLSTGIDFDNLGSNFHLTRNGHGAGFERSGDEIERRLYELAKPYGSAELVAYGKHIDDFADEFEGSDASLETSFFEYGLIWTTEPDDDGDIKFLYGDAYETREGKSDEPTRYHWGHIRADVDIVAEFNWVEFPGDLSPLGIENNEQLREWLELPTPRKVADLVQLFGTENVFGSSYAEGNLIVNDENDKWVIQ